MSKHASVPTLGWPGVFNERGDAVLANPFIVENAYKICNAPYIVNDITVGFCSEVISFRDKKKNDGKHKGPHRLEWYRPGE